MEKRSLLVRSYIKEELQRFKHLPHAERMKEFDRFTKSLLSHDKQLFDKILHDEARMLAQADEEAAEKAKAEAERKAAEKMKIAEISKQKKQAIMMEAAKELERRAGVEEAARKEYASRKK